MDIKPAETTQSKKNNKNLIRIILTVIIICQCLVMCYFADQKAGLNCDEVFTHGLSNYDGFWYSINGYGDWHDASYYNEYLTVGGNEKFNYEMVYNNQLIDVHPPFYYFVFHTVCSFFPNTFSKWLGIGLNIFIYIFIALLIYKIIELITENKVISIISVAFYGFGMGCLMVTAFIRMYTLLTFFCVLLSYLNCLMIKGKRTWFYLIFIMITTLLGSLTHFFFIPFAFVMSAIYCLYILIYAKKIYKNNKMQFLYPFASIAGVFLAYSYYPVMVSKITGAGRGDEAISNFFGSISELFSRIKIFYNLMNKSVFGGYISVLLIIIITMSLIILVKRIRDKKSPSYKNSSKETFDFYRNKQLTAFLLIFGSTFAYFVGISKVAAMLIDRYMMCIYPLAAIIMVSIVYYLSSKFIKNKSINIVFIAVVLMLICTQTYSDEGLESLLKRKYFVVTDSAIEYSDYDCILISEDGFMLDEETSSLMLYNSSYGLWPNEIENLQNILEDHGLKDKLVVYITTYDEELCQFYLESLIENTSYDNFELLNFYRWPVYLLSTDQK